MEKRNGFTLTELVIVVLVVAILAAVLIPMLRGRIDSARWSEGKAIAGTIARALREHIGEKGDDFTPVPALWQLGFRPSDLNGTYFTGGESGVGNFSWVINSNNPIDFLVTVTAPEGVTTPSQITLDHNGVFTQTP
ncbi:MAG: prepilin-type N-terminal cleavage/methylation domain-containing protein [Planctomycetota bacterium]|jgi:prepilin-type N-terminal cleavage/methylation domain-containing protein